MIGQKNQVYYHKLNLPTMNETQSWKSHIDMVSNKISNVIGILYRIKHVFPEYVLFTLYNYLIVSYINYGVLLWGVDCHKLQSLQKKAIRFMTNSSYIAHTAPCSLGMVYFLCTICLSSNY